MMEAPPHPGVSPFSSEPQRVSFGSSDAAEAATRIEEPIPAQPHKVNRNINPRVIKERRAQLHEPSQSVTMRQTVGQTPSQPIQYPDHDEEEIQTARPHCEDYPSPNWMMAGLILLGLTVIVLLLVILFRP